MRGRTMVGRDRERAILDDLLGRIVDGEGGVALVAGEPGLVVSRPMHGAVPAGWARSSGVVHMRRFGPGELWRRGKLHGRWSCQLLDAPFAGCKGPLAGLSRREKEVLAELASGAPNKDIAAALYISVHTVERHIANVFKKLDVRSRSEATAWAHRHNLVR